MGRRFPTPILGITTDEQRCRTILQVATTGEGAAPLSQSTFRERCHDRLRNPETGERYSKSYLHRMLTSYTELGLTDRDESGDTTTIEPSPFAAEFLDGDLPLSEFLWKSLKRSWVAMGKRPEGIEGLDQVLRTIDASEDGLPREAIQQRLAEDRGYEFNEADIRGYPAILQLLGVVEQDGKTYVVTDEDTLERYKRRFRSADVFRTLESRLNREGAMVTPPDNTAKRDMVKYYMYREAGGWQRRRQWYDTVRRDYLQPATRKGNTGSELRRKQKYREFSNRRKEYRDRIRDRFESFADDSLSGLSASVLERIAAAETEMEARRIRVGAGTGVSRADLQMLGDDERSAYTFPDQFVLYDWQAEAAAAWFDDSNGVPAETGIAQVVTGAGKTVMALEVLREWLAANPDGVATVIVPTKVLLQQWLVELVSTLNVPVSDVGWAGDGHKDDFEDHRIIVSIVNSAVKDDYLQTALRDAGTPEHLLIADECHRYTGETFSNVFDYPRSASLGLSATAVSRTDGELTPDDELLVTELGDIYYELTYDDGIRRGLIPEFSIEYIGFDLAPQERTQYERLSQEVSSAVKDIRDRYEHRLYELPGGFAQKLQMIRNEADGPTPAITDYFEYTQERRDLVDNAAARQAITLQLLTDAVENDDKTIVFQERIEQLEQLVAPLEQRGVDPKTGELTEQDDASYRTRLYQEFDGLKETDEAMEELFADPDYWPVMYHSGHSREVWNDIAMEWFRQDDMANVMLSVKALIEGVDVPSADIGIVRVSSSSIRQRIQTLGRILRTGDDPDEESTLYVLYARDTIDERIFSEYDWETELASAQIEQKIWDPDSEESVLAGQIREATPEEYPPRPEPEVVPDPEELEMGDPYEGPREPVRRVSLNSEGQLFNKQTEQYIEADGLEKVIEFVMQEKGGGTLIVNEHDHLLTFLAGGPVFLKSIEGPEIFEETDESIGGDLTGDPLDFDEVF